MTDQPDLSTLPQRMRWAAGVLEEANARYGHPPDCRWFPSSLRAEAEAVEDEDKEVAEREGLAQELYRAGQGCHEALSQADKGVADWYRKIAQKLLADGWTKS